MRIALMAVVALTAACAKDRLPPDPYADRGQAGGRSGEGGEAEAGSESGGGEASGSESGEGGVQIPRRGPGTEVPWTLHLREIHGPGGLRAAADLIQFMQRLAGEELTILAHDDTCAEGTLRITLEVQEEIDDEQFWSYVETHCGDGMHVALSGGGELGAQYATYEWLHRLGVRFFHPEQTYVPEAPDWGVEPRSKAHTPAFRWRSVSLHLSHPLELGDAFALGDERYVDEAVRYIDWQVRNGASYGTNGVGDGEYAEYGIDRGLPRSTGFDLHNQQQGADAVIDPDDPRSVQEQMAEAIDRRMGPDFSRWPKFFSFTFNPTEFTEIPAADAVAQMTFVTQHLSDNYPGTIVLTTNHGSHGAPTEEFGVRFFDLPQFAPPELGVQVHPLMFFDLFRPARVYGNEDFSFLFEFMRREHEVRRIWHFPEAAWWLTFDIAVPLYLPITLDARARDIEGISSMLSGGLDGHRVFGSGHEWGYWQNEWCSLRMAMDLSYGLDGCLTDLTSPMGGASDEVKAVLEDTIAIQERDFLLGDLLRWFVGTDPEIEVASALGVKFHPLPPSPAAIAKWPTPDLKAWLGVVAPKLTQSADDYAAIVLRLHEVEELVPERGAPWFAEIRDGLTVTGLRASHALQVYGALIKAQLAWRTQDAALRREAKADLEDARRTTELALAVIHQREASYRYHPLERSIGGGPEGDADDNWTVYRYRYLNRTHRAYYWTRIDELVADALTAPGDPVQGEDTVLLAGEALVLTVPDPSLTDPVVDFGDGSPTASGREHSHGYAGTGLFPVSVRAIRDGSLWEWSSDVAVVQSERRASEARLVKPAGAEIIAPLLPAVVFGQIPGVGTVLAFDVDADGAVPFGDWRSLPDAVDAEGRPTGATAPTAIIVPIVNRAAGRTLTRLPIEAAVFRPPPDGGGDPAALEGILDTQALIDTVIEVGSFDEAGARAAVAGILGFTPETLPETTEFRVEWDISPAVP